MWPRLPLGVTEMNGCANGEVRPGPHPSLPVPDEAHCLGQAPSSQRGRAADRSGPGRDGGEGGRGRRTTLEQRRFRKGDRRPAGRRFQREACAHLFRFGPFGDATVLCGPLNSEFLFCPQLFLPSPRGMVFIHSQVPVPSFREAQGPPLCFCFLLALFSSTGFQI